VKSFMAGSYPRTEKAARMALGVAMVASVLGTTPATAAFVHHMSAFDDNRQRLGDGQIDMDDHWRDDARIKDRIAEPPVTFKVC
jgi:hypothetical protein